MARIDDIKARMGEISDERARLREEWDALDAEKQEIAARAHRKRIKRNKTLYLQRSFIWKNGKGPTHGDKVTVQVEEYGKRAYGRKWVYVRFRGRPYSFLYRDLTTDKPRRDVSAMNNALTRMIKSSL